MQRRKCSKSGSTLVLVLGAVVIAAMIAVSYLIFTDNLRERAGRTLDQDQREIATEQGILEIENRIRKQLLSSASVDLRTEDSPVFGLSLSFNTSLDGHTDTTIPDVVAPMIGAGDAASLAVLGNGDPFGEAKARVRLIDLTTISKGTAGQQRLPDVQLTATPQIAIREIPVSQFTVYSAGDPFVIAPNPFSSDVGRIFSESNITVSGAFTSAFPVVSAGQVTFTEVGASLKVADTASSKGPIVVSMDTRSATTDNVLYDFLAAARTRLDSRLITSDVLPVACAPLDQIYDANSSGGLNFALLKSQCDLIVVAQVWGASDPSKGYPVIVIAKSGIPSSALAYPPPTRSGTNGAKQNRPDKQSVPFVAYPNKDNPSQTLLAFDYSKLPKGYSGSVYLVAQDSTGKPASNAIVLVRGAQTLSGPLSIVSPHPIVIAGDFNDPASGDAPACSIITAQDVQTQPPDWGSNSLGTF
jgi:hypothetical protein